jgi:hypothetical protein
LREEKFVIYIDMFSNVFRNFVAEQTTYSGANDNRPEASGVGNGMATVAR